MSSFQFTFDQILLLAFLFITYFVDTEVCTVNNEIYHQLITIPLAFQLILFRKLLMGTSFIHEYIAFTNHRTISFQLDGEAIKMTNAGK